MDAHLVPSHTFTLNFKKSVHDNRKFINYVYQWFSQNQNCTFTLIFICLANEIIHLERADIYLVLCILYSKEFVLV